MFRNNKKSSRSGRRSNAARKWLLVAASIPSTNLHAQTGTTADQDSSLIQLLLMMFMLTLIAERIANFFKFYWSNTRKSEGKSTALRSLIGIGNMSQKEQTETEEKQREYRILKVSLFFGCLTAIIFRADLFEILANLNDPTNKLGWKNYQSKEFGDGLLTILGCCFTGVFLSFGSKFWHDLVDLLLQIKNYKKMLTKEGLTEMSNNLLELPDEQQEAILRAAINENYESWKARFPNIVGAEVGFKKVNGKQISQKAIIFQVSQKLSDQVLASDEQIPTQLMYAGKWIPTDVVEKSIAVAQSNILHPGHIYVPARIGTNISRTFQIDSGTIGLKVSRKIDPQTTHHYLVTCFHVLFADMIDSSSLNAQEGIKVLLGDNDQSYPATTPGWDYIKRNRVRTALTANAVEGHLSAQLDVALARVSEKDLENKTFEYNSGKSTTVMAAIPRSEIQQGIEVFCYGAVSGRKTGRLENVSVPKTEVRLKNKNGQYFFKTFKDLIKTTKISEPGDSGAVVLDGIGRVLGIIMAGDNEYSYVLPFYSIQYQLSVNL